MTWHCHHELENVSEVAVFSPKSRLQLRQGHFCSQVLLSQVENELLELPKTDIKYFSLSREEWNAIMSSADDRYVIIKKAGKGWCVALGGKNDYLLEAEKKIIEKKVYREVINSENILSKPKWIIKCLAAWRKRVIIEKNSLNIFPLNKEKPRILVNFISFQKFLKCYTMSQDDQLLRIGAYLRKTLMQWGCSCIENSVDFITKARNLGWIPEKLFYRRQWVCTSASHIRQD